MTNLTDPANGSVVLEADGTVTYTPDPGFAGVDTFTYTAFDGQAESAPATVTVTVEDVTAPALTMPEDIVVEATGPDGAIVEYVVAASDDSDPAPVVECAPASGSLFPLGDTVVECTATDSSGNTATDSFTVTVVAGVSTFDAFIEAVEDLGLQRELERSILSKIEAALSAFVEGDIEGAVDALTDLLNFLRAQEGKRLSPADADLIRQLARTIIDAISP